MQLTWQIKIKIMSNHFFKTKFCQLAIQKSNIVLDTIATEPNAKFE